MHINVWLYVISYSASNYCGGTHHPTAEVQNETDLAQDTVDGTRTCCNVTSYMMLLVACSMEMLHVDKRDVH